MYSVRKNAIFLDVERELLVTSPFGNKKNHLIESASNGLKFNELKCRHPMVAQLDMHLRMDHSMELLTHIIFLLNLSQIYVMSTKKLSET